MGWYADFRTVYGLHVYARYSTCLTVDFKLLVLHIVNVGGNKLGHGDIHQA